MKASKYFGSHAKQQEADKVSLEDTEIVQATSTLDGRSNKRMKSTSITENTVSIKEESDKRLSKSDLVDLTESEQETTTLMSASQQVSKAKKKPLKNLTSGPKDNPGVGQTPFCAAPPAKYRCRFNGTCDVCFDASKPCPHVTESRLVLLLLGHNPSVSVLEMCY